MLKDNIYQKISNINPPSSWLLVSGNKRRWQEIIDDIAEKLGVKKEDIIKISPEDSESKKKIITIKMARGLIKSANLTPQGKIKLATILSADKLNLEASNALLKILEEPPRYLVIILFSKNHQILATIRSRCKVIDLLGESDEIDKSQDENIEQLLKDSFAKQVVEIERIVKEGEVEEFIEKLKIVSRRKMLKNPQKQICEYIKDIYYTEKAIMNNANPRLALENLLLKN